MRKTTTAALTPLREQLDRLAAFAPTTAPVLSLYLDMRADQHGRKHYQSFVRKVFPERSRTLDGAARKSFERDAQRIEQYLQSQTHESLSGLALFACSGADDFFEAVPLGVPLDAHWLFIGSVPHLYPLARLNDQYPRYAALLVDTNSARLFVFSLGRAETRTHITNPKTRKGAVGGWSQARYQRHVENFHLHHMKEVVAVLDRVVRYEGINQIIIAADEAARPCLKEHLPGHLANKVVDVVHLDINAPEHEVITATLDALREHDAQTDAEHVRAVLDAWASGGLGVVGTNATLDALAAGQVEELLIAARPDSLRPPESLPPGTPPGPLDVETSAPRAALDADRMKLAGDLVARAQQNGARVRFIEDARLLDGVRGVAARLRFRLDRRDHEPS